MSKVGSLFTGYGGLDMAACQYFGGHTVWTSDIDPGACKIIAHRFSGVPNLGDITSIDWATVEPVDVITGGSPCQDLSHAGKRAGMTEGTRSNLWVAMREAIAQLRPCYVVWENVRGAYSAEADSAMEPCPGCVGDRDDGPVLRALGRVLGDLAELGYDARWVGLRAADVGAPHGRFRVFVLATDTGGIGRDGRAPGVGSWRAAAIGEQAGDHAGDSRGHVAAETERGRRNGRSRQLGSRWRHEPADGGDTAADADHAADDRRATAWGDYEPAIRRWERVLGRPAPAPTEAGPRGGQRLSPQFVEWMMGLPAGWVTDVPDLSRNAQLKALGNGVVPQQALAALQLMTTLEVAA